MKFRFNETPLESSIQEHRYQISTRVEKTIKELDTYA